MKIAIYSPALNEEKNVISWAKSCEDADYRVVIDTGSKDNTKYLLEDEGVSVYDARIIPWRFDDAYNIAMSLVPDDANILICLHMDERLEPGWRQLIEQYWSPTTTRLRYTYIWNWNLDRTPGRTWLGDRIHSRGGYRWQGATHEGLCCRTNNEVQTVCNQLRILHFPEAKNKSGDLPLLLEAKNEMPHDARMRGYLAREYMYNNQYENATATYKEFLTMSYDKTERGQAMISLSTTDTDNKVFWLKSAVIEVPNHREPLVNLSQHYYGIVDWPNCYKYAKLALAIINHPMDYTCTPEAWGSQPHDLCSIAAWNLSLYKESLEQAKLALDKNPNDTRLQSNLKLIEDFMNIHNDQIPMVIIGT